MSCSFGQSARSIESRCVVTHLLSLLKCFIVNEHRIKCSCYINSWVQDCSIYIANTLEILQSCTKPSMWSWHSCQCWGWTVRQLIMIISFYRLHPVSHITGTWTCRPLWWRCRYRNNTHVYGSWGLLVSRSILYDICGLSWQWTVASTVIWMRK